MVKMGDMLKPLQKAAKEMSLPVVIGKDVHNNTIVEDIAKMPHLLVSGTTGSGKSVFINNLVVSLLYTLSPKNLRFIMIDPKMIELSPYNGIPHLLRPVVTDLNEAKEQLVWAQNEMDRRYQAFSDIGAREINSFNELIKKGDKKFFERKTGLKIEWKWEELPQIVIIVDELADLMITQGKEVEIPITRIAQKARAAGIHLIIATQRPSAEVVTGLIKTNFPTRVAFKVSSSIDSRTILDSSGAEKLLGNGDMLFVPNGKAIVRYQSPYISEEEVRRLVDEVSTKG
jgi:S-DNA-T family DNA segregation ATPase FtsK/SpoIIIE